MTTAHQKKASRAKSMFDEDLTISLPVEKLTQREIDVLTLTAYGKNRGEISASLSISEETVKVYIDRARQKLCALNKTHAATLAVVLGLITPYRQPEAVDIRIITEKKVNLVPQTGNAFEQRLPVLAPHPKTPEASASGFGRSNRGRK